MKSGLIHDARLNEIRTFIVGMHATKELCGRRLHKHAAAGLGSLASVHMFAPIKMRRADEIRYVPT